MDLRTSGRWFLFSVGLNMDDDLIIIEEDQIYEAMVELIEIKKHLKEHFDLWGDNQPWHLFDKLHLKLALMAQQKTTGDLNEA